MRIVVPTLGRIQDQKTLAALGPSLWSEVSLVVRPAEFEAAKALPFAEVGQVWVLPDEVVTLPWTRQWIWERFRHERFAMVDDDVVNFRHRRLLTGVDGGEVTSEVLDPGDARLRGMLAEMGRELDRPDVGLVGPAPTWLQPDLHYWPRKTTGNVVGFVCVDGPKVCAAAAEKSVDVHYDRVMAAEDVDFVLQVLSLGLDTVQRLDWAFYSPPIGTGSGGLQSAPDRKERELAAHRELARLWPRYVEPSKRSPGKWNTYRSRLLKDARRGADVRNSTPRPPSGNLHVPVPPSVPSKNLCSEVPLMEQVALALSAPFEHQVLTFSDCREQEMVSWLDEGWEFLHVVPRHDGRITVVMRRRKP